MKKPEKPLLKKTTLLIPEALWLEARRRALDERTNLRAMLLDGLRLRIDIGDKATYKTVKRAAALRARALALPPGAPLAGEKTAKKGGKR